MTKNGKLSKKRLEDVNHFYKLITQRNAIEYSNVLSLVKWKEKYIDKYKFSSFNIN